MFELYFSFGSSVMLHKVANLKEWVLEEVESMSMSNTVNSFAISFPEESAFFRFLSELDVDESFYCDVKSPKIKLCATYQNSEQVLKCYLAGAMVVDKALEGYRNNAITDFTHWSDDVYQFWTTADGDNNMYQIAYTPENTFVGQKREFKIIEKEPKELSA